MRWLLLVVGAAGCAAPAAEPQPPVVETRAGQSVREEDEPAPVAPNAVVGVVSLHGVPPVAQPPAARMVVEPCRRDPVARNDVRVSNGHLADVLVTLVGVPVEEAANGRSQSALELRFRSCTIEPRIQVAPVGRVLLVANDDDTLHALRVRGSEGVLFEQTLPSRSLPLMRAFGEPGLAVLTCEIHRWERAFVFVSAHPFVRITDVDGAFSFEDVPPGSYELEAWHSRYGRKRVEVRVPGRPLDSAYDTEDPPPPENADELP